MPDHTFQTPRPVDLYVEIGKGQVQICCADLDESAVQVRGRRADDVVVEQDGDTIRVVEPRSSGGLLKGSALTVEVAVPTGSDLTVRTGSADLVTSGSAGSARVRTGSGDLALEVVQGRLEVESGSGDVSVGEAGGGARVKSGSGDVELGRISGGESTVSTGSGDVAIRCTQAPVSVKTGSGDVHLRETHADVTASSGSGDFAIDLADCGRITSKGASGDVRIGIPAGVPVWTDLLTVTGAVRSDLEPTGAPVDGQDHVELRAKTVSGDITLSNP